MAIKRVSLATNDCDPMILGAGDKSVDRITELRLLRHQPVESMALGVIVLIHGWPPAQLFAEKEVANPSLTKSQLKRFAIEL